jgi:hypothetical protein
VREIDSVIVMDRGVDLLTPFVTQLTYHGLIDEILDIEVNKISIDKNIPFPKGDEAGGNQDGKLNFYLTDPVFESLKDLGMNVIGKQLKEKLIEYEKLIQTRDGNMKDMKMLQKFNVEIKKKRTVEPHVNIAAHLHSQMNNKSFNNLLRLEHVQLI